MADWRSQYLSSLKARDKLEKADLALYNRYTKLADRNVELRAELRNARETAEKTENVPAVTVPAPLLSYGFRRQSALPQPSTDNEAVTQLRQDFAKSQRDRVLLQTQVEDMRKEIETLTTKNAKDSKKLTRLNDTVSQLNVKLKDREEELRGKTKLLVNVQDENATLNLELGQADEEVKRVKKENQELIDRWVARMGKEADKMNQESKFS